MPGNHALLSPSAAHRWMNCTAAPKLEAQVKDSSTTFAEEGTLAHAFCAKALKDYLGAETSGEDLEINELSAKYHTREMDDHVDTYTGIVLEKLNAARKETPDAILKVETELDLSAFIPEGHGTVDAAIIADDLLEICDFKYGKGVKVSAVENPQMMIYALGALDEFGDYYDIKRVKMTIIQPRLDNLSEYEMDAKDLEAWRDGCLIPKAREAFDTEGSQEAGEWCRFCKVKNKCRYLAVYSIEQLKGAEKERTLSPEEIARILPHLEIISSWTSGISEYATAEALAGTHFPGYKLVEGRSVRKISDPEGLAKALDEKGIKDYYRPQELKTIGDLERLAGKKVFSQIAAPFIEKPAGKPTLVPVTDKREAINPISADFDDIK